VIGALSATSLEGDHLSTTNYIGCQFSSGLLAQLPPQRRCQYDWPESKSPITTGQQVTTHDTWKFPQLHLPPCCGSGILLYPDFEFENKAN